VKPKPAGARQSKRHARPARARGTIGAPVDQGPLDTAKAAHGRSWADTISLARRVATAMLHIRQDVESDPQWANARARPECKVLLREAQLIEQLWSLLLEGLQAANFGSDVPSGIADSNQRMLRFATRAARKAVNSRLGDHLPYVLRDRQRYWAEETEPDKVLDCVEAWKEALPLLSDETPERRDPSERDVLATLAKLEARRPDLAQRMRVSIAIMCAGEQDLPSESKERLKQIRQKLNTAWIEANKQGFGQPATADKLRGIELEKKPIDEEIKRLGRGAVCQVISRKSEPLDKAIRLAAWALGFPRLRRARTGYDEAKRRAKLENLPRIEIETRVIGGTKRS
jgi:hypothetical protein